LETYNETVLSTEESYEASAPEDVQLSDTEIVESVECSTEALTEVDSSISDSMESISNDVHLILVFVILTFVSACMRGWRNHVLKGMN
jgi:hypothetical protein